MTATPSTTAPRPASRRPPEPGPVSREADARLAAALLADAPGAATLAWERLCPLVNRILRGYFALESDRQELCQEIFLRFFSRIRELRDPGALRGFLIGICLGVAQNERRRNRVRSGILLAPDGELPDQPIPPSDLEAREAVARLQHILTCVDAADRALFVVRHVDKMELRDIAAASGWPLSTTKRRVARVTRRVSRKLGRDPMLAAYAQRLLASGG